METFTDILIEEKKNMVVALVYLAKAQGFRAGVRPNKASPEPGDEMFPPIKRIVFIDFPEKTIMWGFTESQAEFLDSFPQYSE